jgi:hypothetical protein
VHGLAKETGGTDSFARLFTFMCSDEQAGVVEKIKIDGTI